MAAAIALLTVAAYSPVLTPDTRFLWDDDNELWGSRGYLVQDVDGVAQAWLPFERPAGGWHRVWDWQPLAGRGFWPLAPTVFWLEWRSFGAEQRWSAAEGEQAKIAAVEAIANRFHVPNVLLHALNAILVWAVLAALRVPAAPLAGLVFAVHPIDVPSVAWVSELKNTLALFFLLVSLALFLRDDPSPRAPRYAASLLSFFLSLCAKTAGVGFPVVLLACLAWRRGTLARRDLRRVAPFFALALAMALVTLWFTGRTGGFERIVAPESPWHRLANAGWIPIFYAWKALLPVDLMMVYPRLDVPWRNPLAYLPWVAAAVAVAIAWRARKRWGRALLVALVAYGALLFPVLTLFDMTFLQHAEVSDHLAYFAVIPVLALVLGGTATLAERRPIARPPLALAAALLVALLAFSTWRRAHLFENHESLWTDNVQRNPKAWVAQMNLGMALSQRAEALAPGGERDAIERSAIEHLRAALALQPAAVEVYPSLARALESIGDSAASIAAQREGLARAHYPPELEADQRIALARKARILGHLPEAREEYARALALGAPPVRTRLEICEVLVAQGEDRAARAELDALVEAHPSDARARIALAMLLATSPDAAVRDGAASLAHANQVHLSAAADPALRIERLHALAAARAERGEFPAAVAAMDEAERIARAAALEPERQLAAQRREIYAAGRPLRRS